MVTIDPVRNTVIYDSIVFYNNLCVLVPLECLGMFLILHSDVDVFLRLACPGANAGLFGYDSFYVLIYNTSTLLLIKMLLFAG